MESEGPYRIRKGFNYGVVGPGIPNTEEEYDLTPDIANMIYAEGRKAERERCLSIVQAVMCVEDDLLNDIGKGIVKTIKTGGQDGK